LADIQAGLAELAAGKGVEVTPEELAEWERTGELPASVEARLAACG
jgi:predicted transcriptional regulator